MNPITLTDNTTPAPQVPTQGQAQALDEEVKISSGLVNPVTILKWLELYKEGRIGLVSPGLPIDQVARDFRALFSSLQRAGAQTGGEARRLTPEEAVTIWKGGDAKCALNEPDNAPATQPSRATVTPDAPSTGASDAEQWSNPTASAPPDMPATGDVNKT